MMKMYTPDELALAFKVVRWPSPMFQRRALHVFDFTPMPEIAKAMKMTALLAGHDSCHFLTGPQVGILQRIMYLPFNDVFIVNPEVVRQSVERTSCPPTDISFPDATMELYPCSMKSIVQGRNAQNETITIELTQRESSSFFFALDYLNGQVQHKKTWSQRLNAWVQRHLFN